MSVAARAAAVLRFLAWFMAAIGISWGMYNLIPNLLWLFGGAH